MQQTYLNICDHLLMISSENPELVENAKTIEYCDLCGMIFSERLTGEIEGEYEF